MNEASDWELAAQAQGGDASAFASLVRRYQEPLVHFCYRMLGSRRDAEEVAQDSFIRVYRHLPRLTPRARFSTLLFGIARNLALNALRDSGRRGRGRTLPLDEGTPDPGVSNRPDRAARTAQIAEAIENALAELSPEHREVVVLREMQGMDYEAIAQVCGCRVGTVRSRLARGREQLRLHLIASGGMDL